MSPQVVALRRWSLSKLEGALEVQEAAALERYATKSQRNQEIVALAHRSMAQDPQPFIHPLSGKRAGCYDSFSHDDIYNILGFTDGNEPFYVIQRVSSIEAFYFPKRELVISFRLPQDHFDKLFQDVDLAARDLSAPRQFAGFIVAHHRPYHYFYDTMPAMRDIDLGWEGDHNTRRALELVQLQGGDYMPVNGLFPDYLCYTTSSRFLNHHTTSRGKYYFKVGYAGLRNSPQERSIEQFDRSIAFSRFVRTLDDQRGGERGSLTLAFDISTEKGTWKSMEQDIPKIVQHIAESKRSQVHVIFDGWTLPYTPSSRDMRRVKEERRLALSIARRFENVVTRVDYLVGAHPRDKLESLAGVDAFVSRYGTGSMFVSRILRRPGVVHHSGLANYDEVHMQGGDVRVLLGAPASRSGATKVHSIPYDLYWRDVASALLTVLS